MRLLWTLCLGVLLVSLPPVAAAEEAPTLEVQGISFLRTSYAPGESMAFLVDVSGPAPLLYVHATLEHLGGGRSYAAAARFYQPVEAGTHLLRLNWPQAALEGQYRIQYISVGDEAGFRVVSDLSFLGDSERTILLGRAGQEVDTMPPTIRGVAFPARTTSPGGNLSVVLDVEDSSPVSQLYVLLLSDEGHTVSLDVRGTFLPGKSTLTIPVPSSAPSGYYTLGWVSAADVHANSGGTGVADLAREARRVGIGTPPDPPENVTVDSRVANRTIHLSWDAPARTGGLVIDAYRVYRAYLHHELVLLAEVSGATHTYEDEGCDAGRTCFYQIASVNAVGEGNRTANATGTGSRSPLAPDRPKNDTRDSVHQRVETPWQALPLPGARPAALSARPNETDSTHYDVSVSLLDTKRNVSMWSAVPVDKQVNLSPEILEGGAPATVTTVSAGASWDPDQTVCTIRLDGECLLAAPKLTSAPEGNLAWLHFRAELTVGNETLLDEQAESPLGAQEAAQRDADDDNTLDEGEIVLCANENPYYRSDGRCDGSDYRAPEPDDPAQDFSGWLT